MRGTWSIHNVLGVSNFAELGIVPEGVLKCRVPGPTFREPDSVGLEGPRCLQFNSVSTAPNIPPPPETGNRCYF